MYLYAGEYERADAQLRHVLDLAPGRVVAKSMLARVHMMLGRLGYRSSTPKRSQLLFEMRHRLPMADAFAASNLLVPLGQIPEKKQSVPLALEALDVLKHRGCLPVLSHHDRLAGVPRPADELRAPSL